MKGIRGRRTNVSTTSEGHESWESVVLQEPRISSWGTSFQELFSVRGERESMLLILRRRDVQFSFNQYIERKKSFLGPEPFDTMGNILAPVSTFHPSTLALVVLGGYSMIGFGTSIVVFVKELRSFPTHGKGPDLVESMVIIAFIPSVVLYSMGCGLIWPYAIPKRILKNIRKKQN